MNIKIGDYIRIIKCSICYCPSSYLGVVDKVIKIDNNRVYLENHKPVPILFVEKFSNETNYKIFENIYKPNWEKI